MVLKAVKFLSTILSPILLAHSYFQETFEERKMAVVAREVS